MTSVNSEVETPIAIYLAAPWADRELAAQAGEILEKAGFAITEKWWNHTETKDADELRLQAEADISGIASAEAFVVINSQVSEGKAVETGIAMALGIPVAVVGEPNNLFNYLVPCFADLGSVIEALHQAAAAWKKERE